MDAAVQPLYREKLTWWCHSKRLRVALLWLLIVWPPGACLLTHRIVFWQWPVIKAELSGQNDGICRAITAPGKSTRWWSWREASEFYNWLLSPSTMPERYHVKHVIREEFVFFLSIFVLLGLLIAALEVFLIPLPWSEQQWLALRQRGKEGAKRTDA